jgi:hypothetical protein
MKPPTQTNDDSISAEAAFRALESLVGNNISVLFNRTRNGQFLISIRDYNEGSKPEQRFSNTNLAEGLLDAQRAFFSHG